MYRAAIQGRGALNSDCCIALLCPFQLHLPPLQCKAFAAALRHTSAALANFSAAVFWSRSTLRRCYLDNTTPRNAQKSLPVAPVTCTCLDALSTKCTPQLSRDMITRLQLTLFFWSMCCN